MKNSAHAIRRLLVAILLAVPIARLASGGSINFTYDAAGRLLLANYGAAHSASYAYDNSGNLLLSSFPAPAILPGPVVGGQLILSWPAPAAGFTLQQSANLGPTASWSNVTAKTTQVGNLITVSVPVGPATQFYRLQQ
jgi:YD repeat-containing protein